jgi:hypothetical protein
MLQLCEAVAYKVPTKFSPYLIVLRDDIFFLFSCVCLLYSEPWRLTSLRLDGPRKFSGWIGEPPNGCYSQTDCSFMNIVSFLPDIMVPSAHFGTMYCQVVVLLPWTQQVRLYVLVWFALLYVLYSLLLANVMIICILLLSLQSFLLHCSQAVNFIACGFLVAGYTEQLNMIQCWQFLAIYWGYGHWKFCKLLNVSGPQD